MSLIVHDPIRDALRDLVRAKRITGWNVSMMPGHDTLWTVSITDGPSGLYSTDEVNGLIGMFWQDAA